MRFICATTILLLLTSSCAYRWGPYERGLPKGYTKVHVKIFQNHTQEIGIEADITNSLIQQMAKTGVGQVTSYKNAELVVQGEINTVNFLGKTTAVTPQNVPFFSDYHTRMGVVVRLVEKSTGEELWKSQFNGERSYRAPQLTVTGLRTANPIYNQNAKRLVIKKIAQDLAEQAIVSLSEEY